MFMKNLLLNAKRRLFLTFAMAVVFFGISTNMLAQTVTENFEEDVWTAVTTSTGGNSTGGTIAVSSYNGGTNASLNTGNWRYSGAFLVTNNAANSKSYTVHGGTYAVHYSSTGSAYIMTPMLSNGVSTITYWVRTASSSATTGIFVGTNTQGLATDAAMAAATNLTGGGWYASAFSTVHSSLTWTSVSFSITGNASTAPCYIKICRTSSEATIDDIEITTPVVGPGVSLKTGSTKDLSVMQTTTGSIVYSLTGTSTQYTLSWTQGGSPVTPDFITDSKSGNDITIAIAPTSSTTLGDYVYTLTPSDGTTNGTAVTGTVSVTAYSTPAPVITLLTANSTQSVKANATIGAIKYKIANASDASVADLPSDVTYSLNSTKDTLTISGSPATETAYPTVHTYTVSTTALAGYIGSAVTATGTITVKNPSAKSIAYVVGTKISANDTQIYPALAAVYSVDTMLIANVSTTTDFSAYDLVVLTELPSTGSNGMKALWGINKPLLNLKAFASQSNTWAFTGVSAGVNVTGSTTVAIADTTHPIFNNLTSISSRSLAVLANTGTSNALQGNAFAGAYNLATISGNSAICIQEIPVGVTPSTTATGVTSAASQAKYLQIGVADASTGKYTADGIQLVKNACEYLMGTTTYVSKIAQITAITVGGVAGTINESTKAISVTLPFGSSTTADIVLTKSFRSTLTSPTLLTGVDCSSPVTLTLQAEDTGVSPVSYTLTVSVATGINDASSSAKVYAEGSAVVVEGLEGQDVAIMNVAGVKLSSTKVKSSYETIASNLDKGVYVVLVGKTAVKVIVK